MSKRFPGTPGNRLWIAGRFDPHPSRITALMIVRTDRFRTFARDKIHREYRCRPPAAGAELGHFTFDPRDLRAHIEHLVVHSKEPPGVAPFLDVRSVDLQVKLFSGWKNLIGLESLSVDHPIVSVMILANGETNIPAPKTIQNPNDKSALENRGRCGHPPLHRIRKTALRSSRGAKRISAGTARILGLPSTGIC